jgi:hypothetical protein
MVVVGCVCVNDIYKWGFGVVGIWELVMDQRSITQIPLFSQLMSTLHTPNLMMSFVTRQARPE